MIHKIKIVSPHWDRVLFGSKTFEIRQNDRPYQKGDQVVLCEYIEAEDILTGEELKFIIGDIYPIDGGKVVFSLLLP